MKYLGQVWILDSRVERTWEIRYSFQLTNNEKKDWLFPEHHTLVCTL